MPGPANLSSGNVGSSFVLRVPINTAALAAGPSTTERTFTVPGLRVGDIPTLAPPSFVNTVAIGHVRVSAVDTLAVNFIATAGTPVPPVGDYLLQIDRGGYDNPLTQIPTGIG